MNGSRHYAAPLPVAAAAAPEHPAARWAKAALLALPLALMALLAALFGAAGEWRREFPRCVMRLHWPLLLLVAALCGTGVVFIYGTGQQAGGAMAQYWLRQLVWIGAGLGLMLWLAVLDYHALGRAAVTIYLAALFLLGLVLLVGDKINGARSWIKVGPVTLQPSEAAKFGLLVAVAAVAAMPSCNLRRWQGCLPFVGLLAPPMVLIGLQPDMGSAVVLPPLVLAVMFVSGLRWRYLLVLVLVGLLAAPVVYRYGLREHQRERLRVLLDPERDPMSGGWNARQSLLAVGSGGLYGKGFMKGTQNTLGFLPRSVAPTDFIFSVVAEESGFVGSALLLAGFLAVLALALYIGAKARDPFGRNLACGTAAWLLVHVFVNAGMTMGLAPIIGIPLPFVSYGGSFMLLTLASVGVLQSIYVHRRP